MGWGQTTTTATASLQNQGMTEDNHGREKSQWMTGKPPGAVLDLKGLDRTLTGH